MTCFYSTTCELYDEESQTCKKESGNYCGKYRELNTKEKE